jgi:hypothetical protein
MVPHRTVLTVKRHDGLWCVELEGESFGHSREKDVAKAAANRHAREMMDAGHPCQVQVQGEMGYAG